MKLSKYKDILICPECQSNVTIDNSVITCENGHTFNIINDVPVLLDEDSISFFKKDVDDAPSDMKRKYKKSVLSSCVVILKKFIGSTLHMPIIPEVKTAMTEKDWRLNIGSGVQANSDKQVNLEIDIFPNVDIVGSATNLPFKDNSFEFIMNTAVLEHVPDPQKMVSEIYRVLKPGGTVYTEVPFMQKFHAYPNDFQRYTKMGLEVLFKDFEVVDSGVCVGPSSALTAAVADWAELWSFSENRVINDLLRLFPLIALAPLKYLDIFLVKYNKRAHEYASGNFIYCKK